MVCLRAISAVVFVTLVATTEANAQYFGRNKVEYTDFDFRVLETQHFDIYHYREEEQAARLAARLAERWYSRFSRLLHHEFSGRQPLVLYGSQPEFAQTNVVSGFLSDTVGGVTESMKRRIAMPFAPTLAETNRVLGHEIAHAFQFDIGRRHGALGQPLWVVEGMAEYLARGAHDGEASLWLRDAVISDRLPQRERDAARQLSPYQYGHAFWAYLAGRFGDDVVEKVLKPAKRGHLQDRIRQATGTDLDSLFSEWRTSVYSISREPGDPRQPATSLLFRNNASGKVQLGPALSPDGRSAVFFSERDRFALDLYLADVASGRIVRKLATTTASARFDSLQPLRSAGAWSADGRQFVFPVVRQGHAALVIVDVNASGSDREIHFTDLGQILTMSWAPTGRALAFSALAGGFTNLYVYDLANGARRQLTDDAYADLHPAWSPEGREIAFATDRFSTDLDTLAFGRTELAIIDVESGAVRPVPAGLEDAAQINPQWSAGGRHLYFVASPEDVSNVFRLDVTDGTLHQVTHVRTGVSGLSPTSPSLSAASQASVLAFTVYRGGRHQLAFLDGEKAVAGRLVTAPPIETAAGSAPSDPAPLTADASLAEPEREHLLEDLLNDSRTGLPDSGATRTNRYSPRLSLESVGQPYLATGGGAFGTFVRGGGSLLFGDMLGDRKLGAAVQVANRMRDIALETRFLNREHRWNWGAIGEIEPALRRYRYAQAIDHQGQPALMKQVDYLQRMQFRAAGLVAYPLNRGLRVEFTGGVRHERYFRDLRSRVSSIETGRILEEEQLEASGGAPTTVGEVGAAVVGDTTVFGPTGPLLGSRFRFEVTPAAGGLVYTNVLADYRKYLMPLRPYTMALRLLHSGRYGHDSGDPRLLPSFLGSRYYVRGHGWDARDCKVGPGSGCGDELLGNRLVVANLEVRFPVWSLLTRQLEYGPLPMDAFVFADGGMVWSPTRQAPLGTVLDPTAAPLSLALHRSIISSIGAGVRMNAGGLPFEISAVRALDGPKPGWSADFGFRTGF